MHSWIKPLATWLAALLGRPQAHPPHLLELQRLLLLELRQAPAVRRLADLLHLGTCSLPVELQQPLRLAARPRLLELLRLAQTHGSQRSTESRKRTARSTSRRRRAR